MSRIDCDRLILILTGLLGTKEKAEERLNVFEREIEQPLHPGTRTGRPTKSRYPDNDFSDSQTARMRGTDSSYLMARLLRVDPDVAGKIGKGKQAKPNPWPNMAPTSTARRRGRTFVPNLLRAGAKPSPISSAA